MALLWWEYGVIAAIFAGILLSILALGFSFARVRVQKWIGGAIGNFMTNLANQAAEEGANPSSASSSPGTLNLGGFKIDPAILQAAVEYGPALLKLAQQFGLMKGGGGGSTGGSGL